MKIPFSIEYRPQIESGEYKVETEAGFPAKVMDWEYNNKICGKCIAIKVTESDGDHGLLYTHEGKRASIFPAEEGYDLFIVTPEEEMSEFEKAVGLEIFDEPFGEEHIKVIKEESAKLLAIAREQFIKDGYVIEKKAFHDAVEKVSPEVMKEVSENVDKTNEKLTEFEKELESFYNHHLQVCTYDNQGTVEDSLHDGASKLLALARKELCDQIVDHTKEAYENGKAEALKDLPRWYESRGVYSDGWINDGFLYYKNHSIQLSSLEKLPGFKERSHE